MKTTMPLIRSLKKLSQLSLTVGISVMVSACGGSSSSQNNVSDLNNGNNNGNGGNNSNNPVTCSFNSVEAPSNAVLEFANTGQGSTPTSAQYNELISNVADIIYSGYTDLATSSSNLQTKVTEYCQTAESRADQTKRDAAQTAFKSTMTVLQTSLVHTAKGQGLDPALDVEKGIEIIYSWPLSSTCTIDKQLTFDNAMPGNLLTRRGLDAIEHLLFVAEDANSQCEERILSGDALTKHREFNALSSADKQLRRCNYMNSVMTDVVDTANTIRDKWDPADGNYLNTMKSSSDPLVTLNNVSDAMYYIADIGKEDKLAQPMGSGRANTTPSCGLGNACPQDVESPNAKISLDNLIANTQSFETLYYGGAKADKANKMGFDDWLTIKGETALANKISTELDNVLTGLNNLKTNQGTLYNAVSNCSPELETFFDGPFQTLTRTYRDFVLPRLGLQPPQSSLADND